MAVKSLLVFLQEVRQELAKVVWPKWDDFIGATVVVLVLVAFFAVYLGCIDIIFSKLAQYVFRLYSQYLG